MSHSVRVYSTCVGCTMCVLSCPCDVLEMAYWYPSEERPANRTQRIASAPREEDCIGCKRCETACPTEFLSIRVYLGSETTRSLGLTY